MLAHFARRFHPDVFVETGTYRGDTVAKMLDLVPRVVSIELDPSLARLARRRFARDSKVTIIEGDSADELPKIVSELRKPSMFWLDGHFSGGVTADPGTSPIMRELATVLGTKQPHLILVDDIRLFDGTAGYPTLEDVLAFVAATRDDVVAHTEVDVLRIIPSAFE